MKYIVSITVIIVIALAAFWLTTNNAVAPPDITPSATPIIEPTLSPSAISLPTITKSPTANELILPKPGDKVSNPIIVKGKGIFFEAQFSYRLIGSDGVVWFESYDMVKNNDYEHLADYEVKIPVPAGAPKDLFVQVFEYSAKDGEITNLVSVPVSIANTQTQKIQVYFNNELLDPQISCNKTFPVTRLVYKTNEPALLAINELLRGLSIDDKEKHYMTSINPNVRLKKLTISGGVARVDFNETMQYQVGGSCRVSAIRSQIENTLKQFSSVSKVIISVEGRTEDILQP